MTDWVWHIAYEDGSPAHIVLAARDRIGIAYEAIGGGLMDATWPLRWLRLDGVAHRLGSALLGASERHTRTLAEMPLTDDVRAALERCGAIDRDDEEIAVITMTAAEWNAALQNSLDDLGITWDQLAGQAAAGDFISLQARKLWLMAGPQGFREAIEEATDSHAGTGSASTSSSPYSTVPERS